MAAEGSVIRGDSAMPNGRPISVLILYSHPLLGEGIAKLLAAEPGLEVMPVDGADAKSAEQMLAHAPDVVIFERGDGDRAVELLESVPDALVIDVGIDAGPAFTYHREQISARFDGILQAIRQSRRASRRLPTGVPKDPPGVIVRS
jgi:DNA-binding NarL/FixJ family response regulator